MSSVEELFEAMHAWPEVEAIALGGSRATGNADEKSDYDVYLYVTAPVPTQRRKKLLSDYCSRMEIDNNFWENEDNCTLNDGTDIDILYRDLDSFMNGVADVVEHFHASNGGSPRPNGASPCRSPNRCAAISSNAIRDCCMAICRRTMRRSAKPRSVVTKSP